MIFCRTLGPLKIQLDGEDPPRALQWKKEQALLVYMAFAPRHVRSKDHVTGMLWPDAKKPSASLNNARYELSDKGGVVISEDGDQLRLDPSTVTLDTTQFDRLIREGKWPEAAAMVEGPFLDGFRPTKTSGFDEWLETERARWGAKCGEVLVRQAEALLAGGAPEQAEPIADRAQQLAEHSEAALRVYVRTLVGEGRRTEAVEVGGRFVKRLERDLGSSPDEQTLRLLEYIKTLKLAPTPKKDRRGPMVGRGDLLQQVYLVWQKALAGEAGAALVLGDPGMGKTRFAAETMERARMDGATVAIARAVPGDTSHPWIGAVTLAEGGLLQGRGVAGAPPAAIATLGTESSVWAEKFPVRSSGQLLDIPRAMTEVIRAAAVERPVLLVADDAQWMDQESLQALVGVIRSLPESRIMLLVTASSDPAREELDQLQARMGRDVRGVTVTLAPLSHADLVALAKWALPGYDAGDLDRLARRLSVDSGGLALIAYEILTAVAAGLDYVGTPKPWPPKNRTLDTALPVELPDSLVAAVRTGVGRLVSDAKAVLKTLSVVDGPCDVGRLVRGSELPTSRVHKALDQLEWQRWVVGDARGYAFLARAIRDIVRDKTMRPLEVERIRERMIAT